MINVQCLRSATQTILFTLLLILVAPALLTAQTVIHVDDDAVNDPGPGDPLVSDPLEDGSTAHPYDAINEAVDAAVNGDDIVIEPGLYTGDGNRNLSFKGLAITIRSANGPATCIIDCEGDINNPNVGFILQDNEGRDSVLQGITIRNGYHISEPYLDAAGGGVTCYLTSPTITGCWFEDNISRDYGGGVASSGGGPAVIDCQFRGNTCTDHGAGIFIANGSGALVQGCSFDDNFADRNGGAIYLTSMDDSVIRDVVATNNIADDASGGIHLSHCTGIAVHRVTVQGNQANGGNGGGMVVYFTDAVVSSSHFSGNSGANGGGIYFSTDSTALVVDTVMAGNSAEIGGALYASQSDVTLLSCTMVANHATDIAGGLASRSDSTMQVRDSIVHGNTAVNGGPAAQVGTYFYPSTLTLAHSLVEGGLSAIEVVSTCTLDWGDGMLDADPLFVSGPDGDFYLSQIIAGQATDSPCLDTGSVSADDICWDSPDGMTCLGRTATRTDQVNDRGTADMGAHYPAFSRVSASLTCLPGSGTVPFGTQITAGLHNQITEYRWVVGRLNAVLGNGQAYPNWRAGNTVLAPSDSYVATWPQLIPAIGTVIGDNIFTLVVEDVTPAPYNQPPGSPSGSTGQATCVVTGLAP